MSIDRQERLTSRTGRIYDGDLDHHFTVTKTHNYYFNRYMVARKNDRMTTEAAGSSTVADT